MPGILVRLLITALGLWVAQALVPGIEFRSGGTLLLAALLLGLVNAFVRPLIVLLTLPFTVLTLGIFLLIINALMLELVAALLDGFVLHGFGAAFFAALVVSVTSWIVSWYVGPSGGFEIMVLRR
jgi:putative membrane protein